MKMFAMIKITHILLIFLRKLLSLISIFKENAQMIELFHSNILL
jgi:hypothetical protein